MPTNRVFQKFYSLYDKKGFVLKFNSAKNPQAYLNAHPQTSELGSHSSKMDLNYIS